MPPLEMHQPDGKTVEELDELDRFEITGRGTCLMTMPVYNRAALVGRTLVIGGRRVRVKAVEDCLVPGHHEHRCEKYTGALVEFL